MHAPRAWIQFLLLLPTLLTTQACTHQRITADTTEALEWVRLKSATRLDTVSRWQLPQSARIQVYPLSPPPDPAWLAAAQSGVAEFFPAGSPLNAPHYQLLVAWPGGKPPKGPEVSMWEMVDLDQFLPDFQNSFSLRVALVRQPDGVLVDAARLDVSPHWFTSESAGPRLVHNAFRDFAANLRPAY